MLSNTKRSCLFVCPVLILCLLFGFSCSYAAGDVDQNSASDQMQSSLVNIGVVLDLDSPFGNMIDLCMDMAISDFYSVHPNHRTRLQLIKRDAKTVLDVHFAVIELLKHEVLGILGPQEPTQDNFVAAVGEKVHVPIVSYTARSSSLAHKGNSYFVRTAPDDEMQARALAAICQRFNWSEVVVLYEDTEYGNQFPSHLSKAFRDVEIRLAYITAIPTSADDSHLSEELDKLKTKKIKVFLVHMSPSLGYRLFALANAAEMMCEGYAWIITDSLSIFLSSGDFVERDTIDGVLGIRPYIFPSKELVSFHERLKRNIFSKKTTDLTMELNIYGLWAYDTVTALAMAVENVGPMNSSLFYVDGTYM